MEEDIKKIVEILEMKNNKPDLLTRADIMNEFTLSKYCVDRIFADNEELIITTNKPHKISRNVLYKIFEKGGVLNAK